MKKIGIKITALAICLLFALSIPMGVVNAKAESSYTYNYDYWGEFTDSPDVYTPALCVTSTEILDENGEVGLDKVMRSPDGLTCWKDMIYVCDSGNNRILEMKLVEGPKLQLVRVIEEFKGNVEPLTFNNPTDVQISEEGYFYIADKDNGRILKLDPDLNYVCQFLKPNDASLDKDLEFKPSKIAIDTADRVYCVASGINKGLVKYEADTTFSGFIGATPATYNFWDWFWKHFATEAQKEKMLNFVPTEYDNLYMDKEGFIYVVTGKPSEEDIKSGAQNVVRKLNLLGNDILVRNGNWDIYGDLYMGSGGNISGPSRFTDITCLDNDIYICLDKTRGRLFGYDDQGRCVFIFGGTGNMDGYFKKVAAIDHLGNNLIVLDSSDCAITVFMPTEQGKLIYQAIDQFDQGLYDDAEVTWRQVLENDGNCDLAYIGIGRSLLRQKKYSESMEYFKLKHDVQNYSKAFTQYRQEWVEDNIVKIVIVLLILILVPFGIGKLKSIKHEIDTADIFQL